MTKNQASTETVTAFDSASAPSPVPPDRHSDNPFFAAAWDTPYGAPPFADIRIEHYAPAFEAAMEKQAAEISAIAALTEAPTFANTIEALERSGAMLDRVSSVFFNLVSSDATDALEALRGKFAPKLSMHRDAILLNDALWERVQAVFAARGTAGLTNEQEKLLTETHQNFIRSGADLAGEAKVKLTEINAELAANYAKFSDRIRQENARYALIVDKKRDLAGLPAEVIAAAAETARAKGHEGKWAFTLVRSSMTPFLQYARNRRLRKTIYRAYISRGANSDDLDTRELLKRTVTLRAERAELLGFPSHAHYAIDRNMAKTPEAVHDLLDQLWRGSLAKAKVERRQLSRLLRKDVGRRARLRPWDWWYYAERVRKARYDLSEEELKPYFQVDAVRQGAFDTASRLFGLAFEDVTDRVPRYNPEVKAFDVKDAEGQHVGLLYVDYHPRDGKEGGAWMSDFRTQSKLDGNIRPIIVNVGNFVAPAGGKPALLGWGEVQTLFHEFGHALHGLLSNVTYQSLAGVSVKRDYVEFPSQVLENWASEPTVLRRYAHHYETGEPMPDALIEKIQQAATFNQGFEMTELVAAALLDLAWHTMSADKARRVDDVQAFDQAAMADIGLIREIAPRYHSSYFQHIFGGDGYSAGYYVYIWAQVLEADAYYAFEEAGDPFDPALAEKLRKYIFASGGSDEEMRLYVAFRGRQPSVQPLLEKRGLIAK